MEFVPGRQRRLFSSYGFSYVSSSVPGRSVFHRAPRLATAMAKRHLATCFRGDARQGSLEFGLDSYEYAGFLALAMLRCEVEA